MTDASASSSAELRHTVERLIGTDLDGRYRIDELLGSGGMGAVFRGWHRFLDQAVAIKVLRPNLARDPSAARRFVREARGTLKVDSEHAVKVLDFAITADGLLYMVLELLEGRTVHDELGDDGPMAPRRAVRVARQVCDALRAAHKVGLIHRDLKPENIMLVRRAGDPDHAKVLDFGLAKVMEGTGEQALSLASLTQGGMVFGTPDYMAPEQALGQALDARCDLYALGATLFEMLSGRPPFTGPSPLEVLAAHVRDLPPRVRAVAPPGAAIPEELEELIDWCLVKDPARRPGSAEELAGELARIEATFATPRRAAMAETMPVPPVVIVPPGTGTGTGTGSGTGSGSVSGSGSGSGSVSGSYSDPGSAFDLPVRRSRAPLIITAIALAAAAAVVIVALTRPRDRPASATTAAAIVDAGAAPIDAAAALPPIDAGAAPIDAAVREAGSSARVEELRAHLAAAEAARRSGNRLRQIAEADAALALSPGNRQARYLIGDALVTAGDRARGCPYLRGAGTRVALARADAAGCP